MMRKYVVWSQEEIEALCKFWVQRNREVGLRFNSHGLKTIADTPDQGFRVRRLTTAQAEDKVAGMLPIIRQFAEEAEKQAEEKALRQLEQMVQKVETPVVLDLAFQEMLNKALKEQEERLTAKFLEMLKGIPGYSRPMSVKRVEAVEEAPPKYTHQVVVVNALGAQIESIRREFPNMDIRAVNDRMPAETDPDLVVSLTKFMNHPLDRSLQKKYRERYVPVNGAADSVKVAIRNRLLNS
jgi:hypothetical protein